MKPSLTLQQSHSLKNTMEATQRTAQPNSAQVLAHKILRYHQMGAVLALPDCSVVKKSACQCRRCRSCSFHPWVRKSPWSRKRQTHSSILAWRIPWTEGCIKLDTTEHADACTHSLACTNSKYLV